MSAELSGNVRRFRFFFHLIFKYYFFFGQSVTYYTFLFAYNLIKGGEKMQTVYVDVLVLLNSIISLFLILITSSILRCSPGAGRVAAGTFLGGAYSLLIFAPDMGVFLSLIVKILLCVSVVSAVFKPSGVRYLIKCLSVFAVVNFAFAGLMMGVKLLVLPEGLEYRNGAVYFDFGFIPLMLAVILCYVLTLLFNALSSKTRAEQIYDVSLQSGDKCVNCRGLLDTGNTLTDPFTGEGVMVIDKKTAEKIADGDILKFIDSVHTGNIESAAENHIRGTRVLPFSSVGGRGLMPSFHTDKITVSDGRNKTVMENAEIAVSKEEIKNEAGILLNPYMMKDLGRGNK